MTDWNGRVRARQVDRDRVTETLTAAYVDGQIDATEHERRIGQALAARRIQDLAGLTSDLQSPVVAAEPVTGVSQNRRPWTPRIPPERVTPRIPPERVGAVVGAIGVVAAILVGVVVYSANRDATPEQGFALTDQGVSTFLADFEAEFNTTQAIRVEFFEEYVLVRMPTPDGKPRFAEYSYDGDEQGFSKWSAGTFPTSQGLIDLAELDVDRLLANVDRAEQTLGVEDGQVQQVVVTDLPSQYAFTDDYEELELPAHAEIVVRNEFNEMGVLITDLAGDRDLTSREFGDTP